MRIALMTTKAVRHQYFVDQVLAYRETEFEVPIVILEERVEEPTKPKFLARRWLEEKQTRSEIHQLRSLGAINSSRPKPDILCVGNANSYEVRSALIAKGVDVLLVYGTSKLHPGIYTLAKKVALNCHGGLLPGFRGLDSNLWALRYKRFECLGVTWHQIREDLDTGDVVAQSAIKASDIQSLSTLRGLVTDKATVLIQNLINEGFSSCRDARPHARELSIYRSKITNGHFLIACKNFWKHKSATNS